MKTPLAKKIVSLGFTIALLAICLFYFSNSEKWDSYQVYDVILHMMLAFFATKLLAEWFHYIWVFIIVAWLVYEEYLGVSQLLGINTSNSDLYTITGSFLNPGPYGGFLSVCISLLLAYLVKNKSSCQEKKIYFYIYYLYGLIIITGFVILLFSNSRAAIMALGCGLLILLIKFYHDKVLTILKRYSIWLLSVLTILVVVAYIYKKPSADSRFFIDKISIVTMKQNNWKGLGCGSFGKAYGDTQSLYFEKQINSDITDWNKIDEHDRLTSDCPVNAFNEYLYIGVEGGLIPLLIFTGIIIMASLFSYINDSIWCYGLIAFAVFAFFSYPLHTKQFQLLFPVLVALCISSDRKNEHISYSRLSNSIVYSLFIIVLLNVVMNRLPIIQQRRDAETSWKSSERWYYMNRYDYVIEDYEPLLTKMINNHYYLFEYGQALNKMGYYELSDSILHLGSDISCDPMFWNVMGNNSLAMGNYREAEQRYKHAFFMVPNRMYPLYLLAKLYHTECDTTRFLEMADVIESFIPKIESASTENMRLEIMDLKNELLDNCTVQK